MLEGKGEIQHSGANDRIKTLAEDYTSGKVKELPPFMQAVKMAEKMYNNLQSTAWPAPTGALNDNNPCGLEHRHGN